MGETHAIQGTVDDIIYNLWGIKEPNYVKMTMPTGIHLLADDTCKHRCELSGNYPFFIMVMVIYPSVWRIMQYYLTPNFYNYFIYISIKLYNVSRRTIG